MSKIIIDNKCKQLDIHTALNCVSNVIKSGMISNGTYGKQFCFMTTFDFKTGIVGVNAEKRKSGTHKFTVFDME